MHRNTQIFELKYLKSANLEECIQNLGTLFPHNWNVKDLYSSCIFKAVATAALAQLSNCDFQHSLPAAYKKAVGKATGN